MRRALAVSLLSLCASLAACGGSADDPSAAAIDAGSAGDTGASKDSGKTTVDSATPDSSAIDAGADTTPPDTSAPMEVAPPCDATTCGGECVDLNTDRKNCGACGKACVGDETCAAGACSLVCASGTFGCSGKCVELTSDVENCGSCGKKCATGEVCKFAACEKVCTAPSIKCFGECVEISTSATNCGACGKTCGAGESCVGSACVCGTRKCELYEVCSAGSCACTKTTCSGKCVDTDSDAANCGGCGKTCSTGVPCVAGVCVTSTTASYPNSTSTTKSGTLGTGGGGAFYQTGDYLEDKVTRTAPVTRIDLDFRMSDSTSSSCTVGTLTWAVKVNGINVGSYSWLGATSSGDKTIKQTYSFSSIAPVSGQLTIRLEATTTVCSGGGSWNWYPGGTVTMY